MPASAMIDNSPNLEEDSRMERLMRSGAWLGIIASTMIFWVIVGILLLRWLA